MTEQDAAEVGLRINGICPVDPAEGFGSGYAILLGPDEPRFWSVFTESAEYGDGAAHPMDRWSKRVIGGLAAQWGGRAVLPYDGPPWPPFIAWAKRSGRAHEAPTGLLVHDTAGLFLSFRGAVILPTAPALTLPARESPCLPCATRPCANACPVGALSDGQPYDVPKCQAHVRSPDGAECRQGCLVRRACPVSERFGRLPEQSAFHMRAFLGE